MRKTILLAVLHLGLFCHYIQGQNDSLPSFGYMDIFELEYANDPQIAPNGTQIVYRRMGVDVLQDKTRGNLWLLSADGAMHQKLTNNSGNESGACWSPNEDRIAYVSSTDEGSEIHIYWMNKGIVAVITHLAGSPGNVTWSPDGRWLAFTMKVAAAPPVIAKMPAKPEGAKWAEPARITDRLRHEADGQGYVKPGFTHVFVVPAEGGTPMQLTKGNYNHSGSLSWSPDGRSLLCTGNRNDDWEYDYNNSEIYKIDIASRQITALTSRKGPDYSPVFSPDGSKIAYLSYEDKIQAYQVTKLHVMDVNGQNSRVVASDLDRDIDQIQWDKLGRGLYFAYDDKGSTYIAYTNLNGQVRNIASGMGGASLGRPYPSGSFSVSNAGVVAFTHCTAQTPADIALAGNDTPQKVITNLNADLLPYRALGAVEEVNYTSSYDKRPLQGWIVKPPHYDASKKYPLLVENHGGPILHYGPRFSAEMQLYAAAGYLVFYPNARGSTSYGEAFGNLLYHNYPGEDYLDVMDGVDHLIQNGLVDSAQMYVTGGSAGGIMTAWMIGKNNRFKAAVVAKPVVNWVSKTLVADNYYAYAYYRLPGQPWEMLDEYWKFSPLSLVGNIQTPTMVMVGMDDLRTPPSEAKQLYHALKLRKIPSVLVEIPGASHDISARPSNMISQVAHALAWFEQWH